MNSSESQGVQTQFNGLKAGFAVLAVTNIQYLLETEAIRSGSSGKEGKNFISLSAWGCSRVCLPCASDGGVER